MLPQEIFRHALRSIFGLHARQYMCILPNATLQIMSHTLAQTLILNIHKEKLKYGGEIQPNKMVTITECKHKTCVIPTMHAVILS